LHVTITKVVGKDEYNVGPVSGRERQADREPERGKAESSKGLHECEPYLMERAISQAGKN
jgi:hypothetical protein